jgi:hypothetical protein
LTDADRQFLMQRQHVGMLQAAQDKVTEEEGPEWMDAPMRARMCAAKT